MKPSSPESIRLEISMDDQTLRVMVGEKTMINFQVSTSEKGMGFTEGSFRTPTGTFEICEKIGDGEPVLTRFVARVPVGIWDTSEPVEDDLILTRILRLDGKEERNANSKHRHIYIHGTNREDLIGRPASHGCVRLANEDMLELFDLVPVGAGVHIQPLTKVRGGLLFLDCDSTLSSIEGIDELARLSDPVIFAEVEKLTSSAMNGDVPLEEVFARRMEIIRPDLDIAREVSRRYVDTVVSGVPEFIARAKAAGWLPVIVSGGFAPLIEPLAVRLGIRHVEAVPLLFNELGEYSGYGADYPTTRNFGKNEIIREWKNAMLPQRVVMLGDGISDLETRSDVDLMVGFGGVVAREKVKQGADVWLMDFDDPDILASVLST